MSEKRERKISSEELYKGKIISVYLDVMEQQYRYPYDKDIFELPAGKIEKGENPELAAKRELEEETGYVAQNLISLGEVYPSVGYTDEVIRLFYVTDLIRTKRHLDGDEFIDLVYVSIEDLVEQIKNNEIKDAKTVIAILKYLQFIKK